MATYKTAQAEGRLPMPIPLDQGVVSERMEYDAPGALSAGDVIELGLLPAGCVPVDVISDADALGGTGSDGDVGLLNAAGNAIDGTAWHTATLETAGAERAPAAGLKAMARLGTSDENRKIALVVGSTATTAGGKIGVNVIYRAE